MPDENEHWFHKHKGPLAGGGVSGIAITVFSLYAGLLPGVSDLKAMSDDIASIRESMHDMKLASAEERGANNGELIRLQARQDALVDAVTALNARMTSAYVEINKTKDAINKGTK